MSEPAASPSSTPSLIAERNAELLIAIRSIGLTPTELSTLSRLYFDGFTEEQIAEQDNVQRASVQCRHRAALAKIQAANLPLPQRQARHRRRAHRPTEEPTDPALLNRIRLSPAGRWSLGRRRVCDSRPRDVDRR